MTIKTILACVILSVFGSHNIFCKKDPAAKAAQKLLKMNKKNAHKPQYPIFENKPLVKDMTEEQLIKVLEYGKLVKDTELLNKVFFHLISQSKSQENIKLYKLDYADYSFTVENYDKGLLAYEEFGILYPGCAEAEYAQYKAILCTFLLSLSFDRDQTGTQRVISMCLLFLQKAKDEKFITETKRMYASCRQRLFDHEVYVLETYLKLAKIKSALRRIDYIEKEFTDIAHLTENIAYFKDMTAIVENPKTRPFIIKLNLKYALVNKENRPTASKLRRLTSFFLA